MFRSAWKVQGHTLNELSFVAPLGVVGSYLGLIMNILCLIAQFYVAMFPVTGPSSAKAFFQTFLTVPVILLFYIVRKIWKRTPFMRPSTIDLDSGRRLLNIPTLTEAEEEEEQAERRKWPLWKRFLFILC